MDLLASVVLLFGISYARIGMAAVNLTGDWYAGVNADTPVLLHFVQTGTSLMETVSGASGTIDPDTGVFTLTFPFTSIYDCGAAIDGQADSAGNTFTGSGLRATTDPDLVGSAENSSRILIKGKGTGLPDLPLPLDPPVVVQLVNGDNGLCWGASFEAENLNLNDGTRLKAKVP